MSRSSSAYSPPSDAGSTTAHNDQPTERLISRHSSSISKTVLTAYVQLLNDTIASAKQCSDLSDGRSLDPSWIGASYWSTAEKHRFLAAVQRYGVNDLTSIARHVDSKTVPQITHYILVLEDASQAWHEQRMLQIAPLHSDQAANDTSDELDAELERFSEVVESNTHDQLCAKERACYGDFWIIDESRAGTFEALPVSDDIDLEQPASTAQDDDEGRRGKAHNLSSAHLLRPAVFIDLMRNVFMNCNRDIASRWDHLPIYTQDSTGPSILRSAFEDFYQLVLSLTRRLVVASIFQATSRLRGERKGQVTPVVRASDVLAALDVLNMKQQRSFDYWIQVMQRYELDVYSRSSKFVSGHQPMPNLGILLTRSQVENELSHAANIVPSSTSIRSDGDSDGDAVDHHQVEHLDSDEPDSTDMHSHAETETESDVPSDLATDSISQPDSATVEDEDDARERYLSSRDDVQSQEAENTIRATFHMPLIEVSAPLAKPRLASQQPGTRISPQSVYVAQWELLKPGKHYSSGPEQTIAEGAGHKRRRLSPSQSSIL